MPPTELRYRKAKAYFVLAVTGFIFVMMPLSFLLTRGGVVSTANYIGSFAAMIILFFGGRRMYLMAAHRDPVLVFTADGLQFPLKNNRFIQWRAIQDWKIRRHKSTYTLIIHTPEDKTRMDISWLDKPVNEIEALMHSYSRQPGPNGR
ncbi:MAG TPA: hypothetical protein VL307_18015 [Chitinophagaceae bacterium]|nr:hypothetical protein [Chitinophagaceae bacterium]